MTQGSASIAMKRDTLKRNISASRVRITAAIELHAIVVKLQKLDTAEAHLISDELLDLADVYLRGNK